VEIPRGGDGAPDSVLKGELRGSAQAGQNHVLDERIVQTLDDQDPPRLRLGASEARLTSAGFPTVSDDGRRLGAEGAQRFENLGKHAYPFVLAFRKRRVGVFALRPLH
jgi:hypothetical protein